MLGPDEELVAGRRPVEEAFVARRPAIRLLVVPQRRQALERIVLHATNLRIPIVEVEGGTLTATAGFDGHQGVALVVRPRRWASLPEIVARAATRGEPALVLALDSLEDPQNVGTLLRSAEAAGVHGVVFPTHRQAPLSPAAIKASAGATEHLLLTPVDDLPGALADLRVQGLRVVGADAQAPLTARQADLRGPIVLVVGSEGEGLSPAVRRRVDLFVRIPMRGAIGSLNASVAGSILLFEVVAQRDGSAPDVAERGAEPTEPGGQTEEAPPIEQTATSAPAAEVAPAREASATPRQRARRPRKAAELAPSASDDQAGALLPGEPAAAGGALPEAADATPRDAADAAATGVAQAPAPPSAQPEAPPSTERDAGPVEAAATKKRPTRKRSGVA